MIFIETPTFTRLIADLLDDDEYSKMQTELAKRPDVGDLVKNGGGIRKLRWKRAGTGKSGGGDLLLADRRQPDFNARGLPQERQG